MEKEKLEKLIISQNCEDNLIAIEILRHMSSKEIKLILTHGSVSIGREKTWYRHPKDELALYPSKHTGAIKVRKGYIAYNGYTWYLEDTRKSLLTDRGYKIVDSL